jgi:hypothetical protein
MDLVRLRNPREMNVLGLLMNGFLGAALRNPSLAARARSMRGDVWLRAGKMWTTLSFDGNGIEIVRGRTETRRAEVGGEMDTLLGVVTGAGMVGPFLAGKIRIGGTPLFLLRMLPILTSGN